MRPASLIIDMEKEFFSISPACSDSLNSAIEYMNAAIDLFRKKGYPVFVIQHARASERRWEVAA